MWIQVNKKMKEALNKNNEQNTYSTVRGKDDLICN